MLVSLICHLMVCKIGLSNGDFWPQHLVNHYFRFRNTKMVKEKHNSKLVSTTTVVLEQAHARLHEECIHIKWREPLLAQGELWIVAAGPGTPGDPDFEGLLLSWLCQKHPVCAVSDLRQDVRQNWDVAFRALAFSGLLRFA
jgi:hypothetical protein